MAADEMEEASGHLVVDAGDGATVVPIHDQLFIGRECAGIDERRRLVVDDPEVSRSHLEIRIDVPGHRAYVIDVSTNGSLLNGSRLVRAVPTPLRPGDQLRLGGLNLVFHSALLDGAEPGGHGFLVTRPRISTAKMVMVVGDIANYSTVSEATDTQVLATALNALWQDLGWILTEHRGTLNHYAGDALYAVWEVEALPRADELAMDFALAAHRRVEAVGPGLPLRSSTGEPIRMGWAVVQGEAALAAFTRSVEAVIGDSTNLAFRLAGLAGRDGRAPVLVTGAVHDAVAASYRWGAAERVQVKGRSTMETIYPAVGRIGPAGDSDPCPPEPRP